MPDQTLLAHPNQRNLVGKGVKGRGTMLTLADTGDPLVDAFRQHLRPEYLHGGSAVEECEAVVGVEEIRADRPLVALMQEVEQLHL